MQASSSLTAKCSFATVSKLARKSLLTTVFTYFMKRCIAIFTYVITLIFNTATP